nr:hypothetical protein [Tanacetum cinerariifolium]
VMDAPTLSVFAEKNPGDPIDIRVDIVYPTPADVFLTATVVRTLAQHGEAIRGIHGHLEGVPINEEINSLRFRMGMVEEENASLRGSIKTIEAIDTITHRQEKRGRTENMPTTRQGANVSMTLEAVQAMIDQTLLRNNTTDDGSQNSGGGPRRPLQPSRVCSYTDFMKCQPLNFKGTEGVVGLSQWVEKMESFFLISGCVVKNQAQAKDTVILKLKEKLNSLDGDVKDRHVKRDVEEIETLNIELDLKCDDLINKVNLKSAKVSDLNASLQEKVLVITALKVQLNKLKGKAVLSKAVSLNPIDPELLNVDVALLVPKLHKNRTAHIDYIRHTQEEAATLREIIKSERLLSPLNTSLVYACKYTRRIQEFLMILQQTCPCPTNIGTKLVVVTTKNKTNQIRDTAQVTKS